jgi:AcrR family transcriptional regulator
VTVGGPQSGEGEAGTGAERDRVIAAYSKVASELGYRGLAIDRVARYAGISTERCAEHFPTEELGLIAAQDAFMDRLWSEVLAACGAAGGWQEGVRSSLGAVLDVLIEASPLARVFMVEATAASIAAAERQYAFLDRLADLLLRGRVAYPRAALLPHSTERLLIGGTMSIVCERLLAEEPAALSALEPELLEFLLGPYLGPEEAHRQARAGRA